MSFGEWSPSIRSLFLFARVPENEDEKTGGTNRAASLAPTFKRGDRRQRPSAAR
jgi:hypothetical protein